MTEAAFWKLFATAQRQAGDAKTYENDGPGILQDLLEQLPPEEIVSFDEIFNRKYFAAYRWDLWGAAYVIGGGCSDDGFDYVRGWLIAMGRSTYDRVLADPEQIRDHLAEGDEPGCQAILSVASRAFGERTNDAPLPRETVR